MKLNKITLSLAAFAAMALVSCQEGQYWDEVSNAAEYYGFPKTAATLTLDTDGTGVTEYPITVYRSTSGAAASVEVEVYELGSNGRPINPTGYFNAPSTVEFAAGSNSATYTLVISNTLPAQQFNIAFYLPDVDEEGRTYVDNTDNQGFTLTVSQKPIWVSAGTASVISAWAENTDPVDVPVLRCVNYPSAAGNKLMALSSLYWYLEPQYAKEGYDIQFYVDANNDALALPNFQEMGEGNSSYNFALCGIADYGASFTNEGDEYTIIAPIAAVKGSSVLGLLNAAPEEITFTWTGN